jgi:glycosyltransferase involved in cell wall biosynthesis
VPKNLVIVGPIYPYRGGIAHYTARLAAHLSVEHSVRVVSFRSLYPQWLFPGRSQLEANGAPLTEAMTDYRLIPWWPPSWGVVWRGWAEQKPDLIIVQWWITFMAPMTAWLVDHAHQLGIPVVSVCHNVLPHERGRLDVRLAQWGLGRVDRLIVHSAADRQLAESMFPGKDIRSVPFPQSSPVQSNNWSRDHARAALQVSGRLILFFGFVRPYKGLPDLIEAMPAVLQDGEATLLVVGEIWQTGSQYMRLVDRLGLSNHVQFVDRYVTSDEMAMYFAAADVVVLPYRHATTSAAVQLAFAFGVPVIATRTGSMAEAIDDGVTGFLVEPGDVAGLAAAVQRFFREAWAAPFRAAIAGQRGRFSWAAVSDCVLEPMRADVR